jgi:starch synthase (maltosyl-transferring)
MNRSPSSHKARRPHRLALVTTEARCAGAENILAALATRIDRRRFDPTAIVLKPPGAGPSIAPDLRAAGVPLTTCRIDGPLSLPGGLLRLAEALRDARADIVNSHLFHANTAIAAWAALRGRRAPVVATHHIVERRPMGWRFRADRLLDRVVSRHVAVSAAVADHQARRTGIDRSRFRIIHNGIPIPDRSDLPERGIARRRFRIPPDVLAVGSLGRLDPQKGFLEFVPVMAELARRFDTLHWYIGGDGPLRGDLTDAIAAHGLGGRAHLVGFVREPLLFYRALDAFLMPSRYEGFGLVAAEAMAGCCPVAVANVDSLPEIVTDGVTGLVFAPDGDVEKIADWLDADDLRATQAERARRTAEERFSVERMVAQYEALFEEVLEA